MKTGRARIRTSTLGTSLDDIEEQPWKGRVGEDEFGAVGVWNVLSACIRMISVRPLFLAKETVCVLTKMDASGQRKRLAEVWPLIVPPLMTFMDDHEPFYRLKGIGVLRELLRKIPSGSTLFARTGLDRLVTNLRSP